MELCRLRGRLWGGGSTGGSFNCIYSSWYQFTYSGRKVLAIHSFSWRGIMIPVWGLYAGIMADTTWGRGGRLCRCPYARAVGAMQLLCRAGAEMVGFPRKTREAGCSYNAPGLRVLLVSISRSLACGLDKRLKISLVPKLTSFCLLEYIYLKK